MNNVIVNYNPFLPELRVEINGRPLSVYSSLNQYRHYPFVRWCDIFFRGIHPETNGDYSIDFTGTAFEEEIFRKLAGENPECTGFEYHPLPVENSIEERLRALEDLGDTGERSDVTIGVWAGDSDLLDGFFDMVEDEGSFLIDNDGDYLSVAHPLVNLHLKRTEDTYSLSCCDMKVVVASGDGSWERDELAAVNGEIYLLCLGSSERFEEKRGNVFCYETEAESIIDRIRQIAEATVLPKVLSDRAYDFSKRVKFGRVHLSDDEADQLKVICSTEASITIEAPETFYLERTVSIQVKITPDDPDAVISFRSRGSCLNFSGNQVTAVRTGYDVIEAYMNGGVTPVAQKKVRIAEKPPITAIHLTPGHKYLTVGQSDTISISFDTSIAVNLQDLKWDVEDPSVVSVEKNCLTGLAAGVTKITYSIADVGASMIVEVQPGLEEIYLPSSFEAMTVGERRVWKYQLQPEDCFERDMIRVTSSNDRVASWSGGYLIAKGSGDCTIRVGTKDGRLEETCRVTVKKKGLF